MIFGVLMWTKGANPIDAYRSMFESLTRDTALSGILVKATGKRVLTDGIDDSRNLDGPLLCRSL